MKLVCSKPQLNTINNKGAAVERLRFFYAKATLINLESRMPPADKKHQIRKNFKQICPNKLNGSAL